MSRPQPCVGPASPLHGRLAVGPALLLPPLLGVEHEYAVRAAGRQVDVRPLLPRLAALADPPLLRQHAEAFHFPDGLKLTSDGWCAELVTPPEPSDPQAAAAVAAHALRGQNRLLGLLRRHSTASDEALTLHGHSTHLNIEAGPGICVSGLARRIALEFGPVLIFLAGSPNGGGIFVRPRPGRLEVASDFIGDAATVRALLVFLQGALPAALTRDASSATATEALPSLPEAAIIPAETRSGWQLPVDAVSPDLEQKGRCCPLTAADGRNWTLQAWLDAAWSSVRPELAERASAKDIQLLDDLIAGRKHTRFEKTLDDSFAIRTVRISGPRGRAPGWYARALAERSLGEWRLSPAHIQWDFVLMKAAQNGHAAYLNVPFRHLASYADGKWDGPLSQMLQSATAKTIHALARKTLAHVEAAQTPELFGAFNAAKIEESAGQIPRGAKKKKKKKKTEELLCTVLRTKDEGIKIVIPETADPQKVRPNKKQEAPQEPVTVGDGIWVTNGGVEHHHLDHRVPSLGFDFAFVRNYRSIVDYNGTLGHGWDHSYNIRVVPHRPPIYRPAKGGWVEIFSKTEPSGPLTYYHGTGRYTEHSFLKWAEQELLWAADQPGQTVKFKAVVSRYAQNPGDDFEIQRFAVTEITSGTLPAALKNDPIFYRIRHRGGTRMLLNCHGYVVQIRDRNFNRMTFEYNLPLNPGTKYLTLYKATDTTGRHVEFKHEVDGDGQPRLKRFKDKFDRLVEYAYDGTYQLTAAKLVRPDLTKPDQPEYRPTVAYTYKPGGRPGLLESATNPVEVASGGPAYLKNVYDADERVTEQTLGAGPIKVGYPSATEVVVTDRALAQWSFEVDNDKVVGTTIEEEVYKSGQRQAIKLKTKFKHDVNCHVEEITHPGGKRETFEYLNANPPVRMGDERDDVVAKITHHVNLAASDLLTHTVFAVGGGNIKCTNKNEPLFNALLETNTPLGQTKYTYDHGWTASPQRNGNPREIKRPPQLHPDGTSDDVIEKYGYGTGGKPTRFRDADRVEHRYTWSPEGRLATEKVGGLQVEKNDYDIRGNLTAHTDDRGNVWVHDKYDDRGRVLHLKDPLGHEEDRTYDLNDRLKTSVRTLKDDATGIALTAAPAIQLTTENEYNLLGHRTKVIEQASPATPNVSANRTREWRYNAEERVILEVWPTGGDAQISYVYSPRGLEKQRVEGAGGTNEGKTETVYDELGEPALIIDPMRKETKRVYDGYGRLDTETRPDGTELHREYGAGGLRREWVAGPMVLSMNAQPQTRMLSEVFFAFDSAEREIVKREKAFDCWQRQVGQTVPSVNVETRTFYTAAGRLWKKQDPAGRVIEHQYDLQGRLEKVTLPGGHVSDHLYSGLLPISITTTFKPDNPNIRNPPYPDIALTEQRFYDRLGRVIFSDNGQGVMTEFAYDSFGNKRADDNGVSKNVFTYDHFSRNIQHTIEKVTSPINPAVTIDLVYEYDLNDNKTSATDARGHKTVVTHDGRDMVESIAPLLMDKLTFKRRPDGHVKELTRGAGTVEYHYDDAGRSDIVTFRRGGKAVQQRFGYDGTGRVTWAADSNDLPSGEWVEVRRRSDSVGRPLSEQTLITHLGYDQSVRYVYSADQLERRVIYPGLSPAVSYKYGADGNVKEVREFSSLLIKRWHQGAGRLLRTDRRMFVHIQQPANNYELGLTELRGYDASGRLDSRRLFVRDTMNQPSAPQFVPFGASETVQFGAGGLVSGRSNGTVNSTFQFEYDGQRRLKKTTQGQGMDTDVLDYDWDGFNRLHKLKKTQNRAGAAPVTSNQIKARYNDAVRTRTDDFPIGSIVWVFDTAGQLQEAYEYGSLGTQGDQRQFVHDPAGRVARVDLRSAPGAFSTHSEPEFLYDAFGRLVAHLPGRTGTTLPNREWTAFLYDGSNCILELNKTNQQIRKYVYDEAGDLIEARYTDPQTSLIRESLPVSHLDGSPWMIIQRRLDLLTLPTLPGPSASAANKAKYFREQIPLLMEEHVDPPFEARMILHYRYYAGSVTINAVPASVIPIGADGLRFFEEERLLFNRRRFYDPALRAFISPDPIGGWSDPSALGNPHSSAGNNPVMNGDDGNWFFLLLGLALVGAGTGALIVTIRQGIQISEGKRPQGFKTSEVLEGALIGAVLMPAMVFVPELVVPALVVGLSHTAVQLARGQIGWRTALFDAALMGLPFASARGRLALRGTMGQGTYIGQWRGLGEAIPIAQRAAEHNSLARAVTQSLWVGFRRGRAEGLRHFRISRTRLADYTSHTETIPEERTVMNILFTWPVKKPLSVKCDVPTDFQGAIHGHISEGQHRSVAWMLKLGRDIRMADLPYGMWQEVPITSPHLTPDISLMLFSRMRVTMPRMGRFYTDFQTWLGQNNIKITKY